MNQTVMTLALPAIVASGMLGGTAQAGHAQVSVGVHLSWHWSDGGWQSQPIADRYAEAHYYAPAPRPRRPSRGMRTPAVRIPPGHLPPPGTCRLWYVGRPPGHQPPPMSCAQLFRGYHQPGTVIVQGAPIQRHRTDGWYRYDPQYDRELRYDRWRERDTRYFGPAPRYKGPPGKGARGKGWKDSRGKGWKDGRGEGPPGGHPGKGRGRGRGGA